jgi:hypothetical protein
MCQHQPNCPSATARDHTAARAVVCHPQQGWTLLCNGVVVFDDEGELLPDGRALPPGHCNDFTSVINLRTTSRRDLAGSSSVGAMPASLHGRAHPAHPSEY